MKFYLKIRYVVGMNIEGKHISFFGLADVGF